MSIPPRRNSSRHNQRRNKKESEKLAARPLFQWQNKVYYTICVRVCSPRYPAMRMRHIVICGLPRSETFFNSIPPPKKKKKRQDFRKIKKKSY